ncbi:MAG: glycosyltransferase family 2 protein [Turicibacter sp.]
MLSIKAIIVLYNKKVSDSASIISILKQRIWKNRIKLSVSIYDNSEKAMISERELLDLNAIVDVDYVHDGLNKGLSLIYESEFKKLKEDYVLLLDDDTCLPHDFLLTFINCHNKYELNSVYVPKIYSFNKLISPYRTCLFLSKTIDDNCSGVYKNIHAINSGVILPNIKCIRDYEYPPYVKFYGTDSVLFDYINKLKIPIVVLDCKVNHDLSFHPLGDFDKYQNALCSVIGFWRKHYSNNVIHISFLFCYLFYLSLKLSLKKRKVINLFKC